MTDDPLYGPETTLAVNPLGEVVNLDVVKLWQTEDKCRIGSTDYPRIPYGEEARSIEPTSDMCRCGAMLGQYHVGNCQYEECPGCRRQFIGCYCQEEVRYMLDEDATP